MTLEQWLKQQKELCERAAPGPWCSGPHLNSDYGHHVTTLDGEMVLDSPRVGRAGHNETSNNAGFTAGARTSLPQALRIIEEIIGLVHNGYGVVCEEELNEIAERIINEKVDS